MRILFLAPQPFFRLRGLCLALRRCLQAYSRAGVEVDLVTFPFGEDVVLPGLTIHRLRPLPGIRDVPIGPSWSKAAMDIPLLLEAARLCAARRYDFIHASEEAALIGAALKAVFGARLAVDMDDVLSDRLHRSGFLRLGPALAVVRFLERWALSRADVILTNSEDTTAYARLHGRAAEVRFYDHLPPLAGGPMSGDDKRAVRRAEGWEGREVLLYVGNLEPYQGLELLVDALPEIRRLRPAALCVVVGGRPEQVELLRRRASALGVGDCLLTPGPRPFEASFRLMCAADALVSPIVESKAVPMKLYSYLAAGVPIVATDLPNHAELLDRRGLSAPRADELARAAAFALETRPVPVLTRPPDLGGSGEAAAIGRVMQLAAR